MNNIIAQTDNINTLDNTFWESFNALDIHIQTGIVMLSIVVALSLVTIILAIIGFYKLRPREIDINLSNIKLLNNDEIEDLHKNFLKEIDKRIKDISVLIIIIRVIRVIILMFFFIAAFLTFTKIAQVPFGTIPLICFFDIFLIKITDVMSKKGGETLTTLKKQAIKKVQKIKDATD